MREWMSSRWSRRGGRRWWRRHPWRLRYQWWKSGWRRGGRARQGARRGGRARGGWPSSWTASFLPPPAWAAVQAPLRFPPIAPADWRTVQHPRDHKEYWLNEWPTLQLPKHRPPDPLTSWAPEVKSRWPSLSLNPQMWGEVPAPMAYARLCSLLTDFQVFLLRFSNFPLDVLTEKKL